MDLDPSPRLPIIKEEIKTSAQPKKELKAFRKIVTDDYESKIPDNLI